MSTLEIKDFFHKETSTITYLVWDPVTKEGMIMDPVMDYDPAASKYSYDSVDTVMKAVESEKIKVKFIVETHAHADHLSGSQEYKRRLPGSKIAIGKAISVVQATFKKIYNLDADFKTDGSQFDILLDEGDVLGLGNFAVKTIHTPGHTPACYSFLVGDALFSGDALFMPDFGVGRCDFPAGSAEDLYDSVHGKLYTLSDETRVFTAHDYQPGGREYRCESSIGEQKASNIHIKAETAKADFVKFRTERDAQLSAPKLLLPSLEVNVDAGRFPEPEDNGVSYLKIPLLPKSR